MSPTGAKGVCWNLGDLYATYDDPAIEATLNQCAADAEQFAADYRGTINRNAGPAADHLLAGLQRLEALYDTLAKPGVYASLLFSGDTSNHHHRNLQQHVEQRSTSIYNMLLFFDLEWLALSDDAAQRLIADPALAAYHHHLLSMRRYKPHTLTEAEERVINEKDITGAHSWRQFFTEQTAALSFPFERDGSSSTLTLDEVLTLLRHPQRALRQQAHSVLYERLASQAHTRAYIYNTLMQDHHTMDRLRAYPDPMAQRHLANEIAPATVETMMQVVEDNYPIAATYFNLKQRLLQIDQMEIYDQYAPMGESRPTMDYAQAKATVLEAFGAFDPLFRDTAAQFFDRHWIDAEVREGKRGGAFCSGYPPSLHPYVLCNYTGDLRDVMTVAHELGHGVHFCFSQQQTLFNYSPTLPLAETASVFGEMLVFEHLLKQDDHRPTQLALVCSKIEDIFATIFRQTVLTRFEQAAFAGRAQMRLTPEHLCEHWLAANARYYGDAVAMTSGYEYGWSYIPHFIHTPFYCYSYVFGELLVLALYGIYRDEGAAFVPRYRRLLEAGGSQSPDDLLAALDIDTRDAAFWQRGFDELTRLVDWAHELAG